MPNPISVLPTFPTRTTSKVVPLCPVGPRRRIPNLVKSAEASLVGACLSTLTSLSLSAEAVKTEVLALSHHSSTRSLTIPLRPTIVRCHKERAPLLLRRKTGSWQIFAQTCRLLPPWQSNRTTRANRAIESPIGAITVAMVATRTTHLEMTHALSELTYLKLDVRLF